MKRGRGSYLGTALLAGAIGWLAGLVLRGPEAVAVSASEAALASAPTQRSTEHGGEPNKRRLTKSADRDDADPEDEGGMARVLYHPDGSVTFPEEWTERLWIHPFSSWDLKVRAKDMELLGVSAAQSEALQGMLDRLLEERKALEAKACKVIERKEGSVLLKLDAIKTGDELEARAMREMQAILQERTALVMPLIDRQLGGLVSDAGPQVIYREQLEGENAKYEEIEYDPERAKGYDRELTIDDYRTIRMRHAVSQTSGDHPRLGHLFQGDE